MATTETRRPAVWLFITGEGILCFVLQTIVEEGRKIKFGEGPVQYSPPWVEQRQRERTVTGGAYGSATEQGRSPLVRGFRGESDTALP